MQELQALPRKFFEPSAKVVAAELLGHWLVRRWRGGVCGGPIVETEAYLADDPACHAAPGLTRRNRVMFGPPGHAYVYFIYGCHFCVNAVCQPEGRAEAVLIRAVEPLLGLDFMSRNRPVRDAANLTNGPGKVCEAMAIRRNLDGADLCDTASGLFVARNEGLARFRAEHGPMLASPRVGLTKAADLELRFYLKRHTFVSKRRL